VHRCAAGWIVFALTYQNSLKDASKNKSYNL
jgi:hypothetical protein